MFEELGLVLLGLAAGILGSMIGLGGGIIVVPVLTFFGFSPTLAASSSLFAAFSNAVASTISYSRQKRIDYSVGFRLALFAIPGTVLGAYVSSEVTPTIFKILFGLVLVASSVYIFYQRKIESKEYNKSKQIMILVVAADFFSGILSGFFGIGGGIIFVPLMIVAMGMGMKNAAPTSQLILLFVSFCGLITHSVLGHPDYYQALLLSAGAFAGGIIGARISLEVKEKNLQILVSVVIVAAAAKLFYDSISSL